MDKRRKTPQSIQGKQRRRRPPEEIEEIKRRKRMAAMQGIPPENFNNKKVRKKKKKKKIKNKIFMAIGAIVSAIILIGIISIITFISKVQNNCIASTKPVHNQNVNILVLGMDIGSVDNPTEDSIKRTDTIMVINYKPKSKTTKIVSIPRDTRVEDNGSAYKINAAYQKGGEAKVASIIQDMLSITINYVIKVNYKAFRDFIDSIGGIDMEIERDMIYDDDAQNLHINFKGGTTVHLDGQKAEEFFRWRKNNDGTGLATGDLGRIENQQKFLSKVVKKCKNPLILFRAPIIMNSVAKNIDTNMTGAEMIYYGLKLMASKGKGFNMTTIAGEPKMISGQSYLVFDPTQNADLINDLNNSESTSDIKKSKEDYKILVLNGTNTNGLAAQVKSLLITQGFTNVETGNASATSTSSVQCSDEDLLKLITTYIPKANTSDTISSEYSSYDVVVIIGSDYTK